MSLPEYVTFGSYRAKITLEPALTGVHGLYSFESSPEITISKWGDKESAAILLHETIHFMSDCMGLGLNEAATRRLEFALSVLLKDNSDLMLHILAALSTSPHRNQSNDTDSDTGTDPAATPAPDRGDGSARHGIRSDR